MRDLVTGESIPNAKFMNMYVHKVQPARAILEGDYFIRAIEECEAARDEEIRKVEAGIEGPALIMEPKKEQVLESDWDKLMKLPDAEYLMRTVLPELYQGMRVVELERPSAPLEYLALYLLKH